MDMTSLGQDIPPLVEMLLIAFLALILVVVFPMFLYLLSLKRGRKKKDNDVIIEQERERRVRASFRPPGGRKLLVPKSSRITSRRVKGGEKGRGKMKGKGQGKSMFQSDRKKVDEDWKEQERHSWWSGWLWWGRGDSGSDDDHERHYYNSQDYEVNSNNDKNGERNSDEEEDIIFVGLDCEMVGAGRGGTESLLARCSIVAVSSPSSPSLSKLQHKLGNKNYDKCNEDNSRNDYYDKDSSNDFEKCLNQDNSNEDVVSKESEIDTTKTSITTTATPIVVLYDKYVRPTKKVTDYRTQWSGIVPSNLSGKNTVSFDRCRMDVATILKGDINIMLSNCDEHRCNNIEKNSISCSTPINIAKGNNDERSKRRTKVILVGHSLENDLDILRLRHPSNYIRDTATYPPFMSPSASPGSTSKGNRRRRRRKLSHLCLEYLGWHIQEPGESGISDKSPVCIVWRPDIKENKPKSFTNTTSSVTLSQGHDSIEDAAAALLLYRLRAKEWEASLGYPLSVKKKNIRSGYKGQVKKKVLLEWKLWLCQWQFSWWKLFWTGDKSNDGAKGHYIGNKGYPIGSEVVPSLSEPSTTLYLDGCNLPLNLQFLEKKGKIAPSSSKIASSSISYVPCLLSRKTPIGADNNCYDQHNCDDLEDRRFDWIPFLKSMLAMSPSSAWVSGGISRIVIVFDGKAFDNSGKRKEKKKKRHINSSENSDDKGGSRSEEISHFLRPGLREIHPNVYVEITSPEVSADDILIEYCQKDSSSIECQNKCMTVSVENVINILSEGLTQSNNSDNRIGEYIVVRRSGGGKGTAKKVFGDLNLRRPKEGGLCLCPSFFTGTDRLQHNSIRVAKELEKVRGVQDVVSFEARPCHLVRSIIVTDDVFLTERVLSEGAIVLSSKQFWKIV